MRYTYAYKTSDGTRHEAAMEAESRDEVFAALRRRGIRAIKVVAADGSRANGEVRGVRRRTVALVAGLAGVGVGAVAYVGGTRSAAVPGPDFRDARTRRQVIGDAAVIEKGIATGWADVFDREGERFLASFAVPGVKAGQRSTSVGEIRAALGRSVPPDGRDSMEARQIKAMVEGMKDEARRYVADGGTVVGYGRRLTERQDAEIAVYRLARDEVERARRTMPDGEFMEFWERRNGDLRNLGIRPVPLPE